MTIYVLEMLYVRTIVVVGVRANISQGYTAKSQENEFNNYLISLLKFHIKCVIELMCKKRRRENDVKKRDVMSL